MGRLGYLLLAVLVALLLGYLLWPSVSSADRVALDLPATPPQDWEVRSADLTQVLSAGSVWITSPAGTWQRPPQSGWAADLWRQLTRLRVPAARVKTGVAARDLPAYGFAEDGLRVLATGLDLRLARAEQACWCYEGTRQRMFRLPVRTYQRLEEQLARIDDQALLAGLAAAQTLTVGGQLYRHQDERWVDAQAPDRPAVAARVQRLCSWLIGRQLRRFTPVAIDEPLVTLRWNDQPISVGARWIRLGELPAQALDAGVVAELQELVAELARERIAQLSLGVPSLFYDTVWLYRPDGEPLVLQRSGDDDIVEGRSRWSLRWAGGRVRAAGDAAEGLVHAVNAIELADWRRREPAASWQAPAQGWGLRLLRAGTTRFWLQWDRETVRSAEHAGMLATLPEPLVAPVPADFIDPQVLSVAPARIVKIQRQGGPDGAAVYARGAQGWQQTYPAPATVEDQALERFLLALTQLRAEQVLLPDPTAPGSVVEPERQLAVRIAPLALESAHEGALLEETVSRDWALLLERRDGQWYGLDQSEQLAYQFTEKAIAALFAPLDERRLLPLIPSQVQALAVTAPGHDWQLERSATGFVLSDGAYQGPAAEVAVRRYLQDLAALDYRAVLGSETALQVRGQLRIELPGIAAERQVWFVRVAEEGGRHLVEIARLGADRVERRIARYQVTEAVRDLLLADAAALHPDQQRDE